MITRSATHIHTHFKVFCIHKDDGNNVENLNLIRRSNTQGKKQTHQCISHQRTNTKKEEESKECSDQTGTSCYFSSMYQEET